MNKKIKVIAFSGIDGAGKSTQINYLKDFLIARNESVFISKAIFTPFHEYKSVIQSEELLCLATAFEFVRNSLNVQEIYGDFDYIISDRHKICYLALALAFDVVNIESLKKIYSIIPHPDLLIYLDVSVDEALKRIKKRNMALSNRESYEMLVKFKTAYEVLLEEHYYKELVVIDAMQSADEVIGQIEEKVIKKIMVANNQKI